MSPGEDEGSERLAVSKEVVVLDSMVRTLQMQG